MNFKKILTGSLAGAMALSMAVPAFAASANSSNLSIAAKAQVPTINVSVPTSTNVILNPYKLTVNLDKTDTSTDQIATKVMYLKNLSNCPIQLGVKVSGTVAGNAKLVEASTSAATNDGTEPNNVFMYFEGQIVDSEEDTLTWEGSYDPDDIKGGQVIVGKTATAPASFDPTLTTIKVGDNVLAAATLVGKTPAEADGLFAFKLFGDAVKKPKTAWAAADTVTTTLAFTFTPAVEPTAAD